MGLEKWYVENLTGMKIVGDWGLSSLSKPVQGW